MVERYSVMDGQRVDPMVAGQGPLGVRTGGPVAQQVAVVDSDREATVEAAYGRGPREVARETDLGPGALERGSRQAPRRAREPSPAAMLTMSHSWIECAGELLSCDETPSSPLK